MTIKPLEVTVGEITMGYVNNDEQGVRGYYGKLDIRPPYQREFIYNEKEQQAVIRTVLNGYPLSSMYWVKRSDDAECPYEVMDGQQRTLSICEYVAGKFSYEFKNFFNQPEDIQRRILNYPLTIYVCEGTESEKLEWFQTINDVLQSPRLTSTYDYYVPTSKRVELPTGNDNFAFRFAAMNYQLQHRMHYQYMLEGYDKDWRNAGKDRMAFYSGVPAGTYTFKVKAFLLESPDQYDLRTIEVVVPNTFLLSPTAIIIYATLLILLAVFIFIRYRRAIKALKYNQ